ncbi:hypothetical protein A3K73_03570 [Candidatus Pacearchaeota archaeon RBG_13_36_9]|nr:MAG: hypothetical protein A3K73_03570 [Candidatus Pacearchaeota archaeon RBG_13_36_9]
MEAVKNKPTFFLTNRQRDICGKRFNTPRFDIQTGEAGKKAEDTSWRPIPSRYEDSSDTPEESLDQMVAFERDVVVGEYDHKFKRMLYFASRDSRLRDILGERNYRKHLTGIKEFELQRIEDFFEKANKHLNNEKEAMRLGIKLINNLITLEFKKQDDHSAPFFSEEKTYVLKPHSFIETYFELTLKRRAKINDLGGELSVFSHYGKDKSGQIIPGTYHQTTYSQIGRVQAELALQEHLKINNLKFTPCGKECFSRETEEPDSSAKEDAMRALEESLL